jgi:hypothetical protein
MRTNSHGEAHIAEAHLAAAIQAWANCMGIDDVTPIRVATERATEAYRHGATVAESCGVAEGFVLCWLRHPANGGRGQPERDAA